MSPTRFYAGGRDRTDYEQSPSGGYRLVYSIYECDAANCTASTAVEIDADPRDVTHACENHTLEEFEAIAEVKVR
ncbi:hypothetical protein ACFQPA_21915 [Halomarina halobia]|uniref:Uncharacterized protein n=1 Tax=Halomarina halobia TaxID=3033386 RepID=A0ABD6AFA6_9EURY|nr:hypothetical protein [Halomarina sp. PSR21]